MTSLCPYLPFPFPLGRQRLGQGMGKERERVREERKNQNHFINFPKISFLFFLTHPVPSFLPLPTARFLLLPFPFLEPMVKAVGRGWGKCSG